MDVKQYIIREVGVYSGRIRLHRSKKLFGRIKINREMLAGMTVFLLALLVIGLLSFNLYEESKRVPSINPGPANARVHHK